MVWFHKDLCRGLFLYFWGLAAPSTFRELPRGSCLELPKPGICLPYQDLCYVMVTNSRCLSFLQQPDPCPQPKPASKTEFLLYLLKCFGANDSLLGESVGVGHCVEEKGTVRLCKVEVLVGMCFCWVRERLAMIGRDGGFEITVISLSSGFSWWKLVERREKAIYHLPPCKWPSQNGLHILGHICCLSMILNNSPFLWIWSPYVWIPSGFLETFVSRTEHQLPGVFFPVHHHKSEATFISTQIS